MYDLLPARWRARNPTVEAVGRLDKDTTGLLLLTDDGELLHRLTSPKKDVPKTYELEVDADVPEDAAQVFASGRADADERDETVRAGEVDRVAGFAQGRHARADRGAVSPGEADDGSRGCTVTRLHRSAMGALTLGRLTEGEVRAIDREELERRLVDDAQDT